MNTPATKLKHLDDDWFPPEQPEKADPAASLAAIYLRYSTRGQRPSSLERQNEGCKPYAKSLGLGIYDTYADPERTGTMIAERDEWQRLLEDARAGKFRHVIVEEVDRLGREFGVGAEIWSELCKCGITIHTPKDGRLSLQLYAMKAANAEVDWQNLISRMQDGKRKAVREGAMGTAASFGYSRVYIDGKFVIKINEDQAQIVREIFDLYTKGVSPGKIAKVLNERPLDKRGNRTWTKDAIAGSAKYGSGILRRFRYIGVNVYGRTGSTYKNGKRTSFRLMPPSTWETSFDQSLVIIPREVFAQTQKILMERASAAVAKGNLPPRYTSKHYPLRGLMRCKSCGAGMTPSLKRADTQPRVSCNKARNNSGCENKRSVILAHVDEIVREILVASLATPEALQRILDETAALHAGEADKDRRERARLDREFAEVDAQLQDLQAESIRGRDTGFPPAWLDARVRPVADKWEELKGRVAEMADRPPHGAGPVPIDIDAMHVLVGTVGEVFQPCFKANTKHGVELVAALRCLIKKIRIDIQDDHIEVEVNCKIPQIAETGIAALQIVTFVRQIMRPGTEWADNKTEMRRIDLLVREGHYALTDEEWALVAPLLPDCVASGKRGLVAVDTRNVVRAALFHINENVPLVATHPMLGPAKEMFAAMKRLSASGGWDAAFEVLQDIRPDWVSVTKNSAMFGCKKGRHSSSLRGLPLERVRHGIAAAEGRHAPTDAEWKLVADLIPEQCLHVDKCDAPITPRDFFHGMLYLLKARISMSCVPARFGSERFMYFALKRLVAGGFWDKLVERLQERSPATLEGADLARFDRWPRSVAKRTVFRRALANVGDRTGTPGHDLTETEWGIVKKFFLAELLFVGDVLAVKTPRLLAHIIMYRLKAKVPFAAFPEYFGDRHQIKLVVERFVFRHLWDAMLSELRARSPHTLEGADLSVFDRYRRGRRKRYRDICEADAPAVPAHEPSEEMWSLMEDLVPVDLLMRGGIPDREPRRFLHALLWMLNENLSFSALPAYFGDSHQLRLALRRLVRHHYWDAMSERFREYYPEWSQQVDLGRWDFFARSKNSDPGFRPRRPKMPTVQLGSAAS